MISKLAKMQSKDVEDDPQASNQQAKESGDLRPAWIRALEVTVTQLHSLMPKVLQNICCFRIVSLMVLLAIPKAQAYRPKHQGSFVPLLRKRD